MRSSTISQQSKAENQEDLKKTPPRTWIRCKSKLRCKSTHAQLHNLSQQSKAENQEDLKLNAPQDVDTL